MLNQLITAESRHFENNLREKQQAFYEQIRETFDIDELSLVLPSCRTFTVTRADIVKTVKFNKKFQILSNKFTSISKNNIILDTRCNQKFYPIRLGTTVRRFFSSRGW